MIIYIAIVEDIPQIEILFVLAENIFATNMNLRGKIKRYLK